MDNPEMPHPEIANGGRDVIVDAPTLVALAAAAEAQARLLDAILNTSEDFIFVIGPDGRYLYVSATVARSLGLPREQIVGRSAETLGVGPALTAWMAQQRGHVLATGEHLTGDFRYPNAAGEERDYLYRYSPLRAPDGAVEAVLCTAQDVTEQRRAEAQAAAITERLLETARRDHEIAAALQRSLLLMPPPDAFPGLEIVSRYESATADMEAGGDFLDAFLLDRSRVALVVGDVAGKGLEAAASIAEVKFTLRGFLREYPSAAIGLKRLNGYLCDTPQWEGHSRDSFVCLSLAIYDTATGALTASVAGEEMPLLVRADGRAEPLPTHGMPVGVMPDADYAVASAGMEVGDILILVTDGIMEARQADAQWGMEGLRRAVAAAGTGGPMEALAERIMDEARAFGGGRLRDDAAVLLARRVSES